MCATVGWVGPGASACSTAPAPPSCEVCRYHDQHFDCVVHARAPCPSATVWVCMSVCVESSPMLLCTFASLRPSLKPPSPPHPSRPRQRSAAISTKFAALKKSAPKK